MSIIEKTCRIFCPVACLLVLSGCASLREPHGATSTVIGPVYERSRAHDGTELLAVRPVYARTEDGFGETSRTEVLWPLFSMRRRAQERNWRFIVWFGTNYDITDADSRARVWLLPVWFHGRNAEGEPFYAFFPLGGRIDDFIGMDRFSFVLFPLYERHTINDVHTTSVLWPLISWSDSERKDIRRLSLFPVYGYSRRGADWTSRYWLWPIWTSRTFTNPSRETGRAWMVFPLFGRIDTNRQQGWYVLPPFFSDLRRGESYRRRNLPWPLVQLEDGTVRKRYLWPLAGVREAPGRSSGFVLWPLYRARRSIDGETVRRHRRLLPFWDQARVYEGEDNAIVQRYDQLWPIWARMQSGEESVSRMLDLWPGRNREAIDRNWAPWWTLYQRRTSPRGASWDALFGLARYRVDAGGARRGQVWPLISWRRAADDPDATGGSGWRVLGGLFGRERDPDGTRRWRFMYGITRPLGGRGEGRNTAPATLTDEERNES